MQNTPGRTKLYFHVAAMKVIFGKIYLRKTKNCLLKAGAEALGA